MRAKRPENAKARTLEQRNARVGYLMISPILIGIALFSVVPVVFSLFISFTDWDMLHEQTWIGLENYRRSSPATCWESSPRTRRFTA